MLEQLSKRYKILLVFLVLLTCGLAAFFYVSSSSKPFSQTDADSICQKLHDEMTASIGSVPGYAILDSQQSCTPTTPDEMNNTDYGFEAVYRLSKAGSDTESGIKKNMESLARQLPKTHFTVWIGNDNAPDGRPDTICARATTLIQGEYGGEIYNSFTENIADYRQPGTSNESDNCLGLSG